MTKIIVVITLQYMNFLRIFGFSGDPGSSPSILIVFLPVYINWKNYKKDNPPNNDVQNC